MLLRRLICFIAIALGFAPILRAEGGMPRCASIESSVDSADRIVVGDVNHVGEPIDDDNGVRIVSVDFDVEQTIKGTASPHLSLEAKTTHYQSDYVKTGYPTPDDFNSWKQSKARLLIFIANTPGNNHYVWIIDLSSPQLKGVTAGLTMLKTPAELIQAAKHEMRRTSGAMNPNSVELEAPHPRLKGTVFENCYISVPFDDRLLQTEEGRKELADMLDDADPATRAAAKAVLEHRRAQPMPRITSKPQEIFRSSDDTVPHPVELPNSVFHALGIWLDGDFPPSRSWFSAEKLRDPSTDLQLYVVMGIENNREYYKGYKSPFWLIEEDTQTNKAKILWGSVDALVALRVNYRDNEPYPDIETNFGVPESMFKATYRYKNGAYFMVENNYHENQSNDPAPFKMKLEIPKLPPEPVPFMLDFPHPGPIADADPSIRHHVALVVPGRLAVTREAKRLSVTINSEPHRRVDITVGKNMVIGEREDERIYEAGKPRPAESQRFGLTDLVEEHGVATIDAIGTIFYNLSQDHFPEPGKTYIVEIKLTVFETKSPPQHMWMPTRMDKVLWTGTLKTTVGP